jgi:tRNA(Ile)-lysidine synthase
MMPNATVAHGGGGDYPWRMEPRLPDIARATATAHHMLPQGASVLAMVSGGADSVALLRLLASGALGDLDVSVLHVDHMLRGDAAAADAAFVAALCEGLGVPCRVARYDVGGYAATEGLNVEDAGRRVRYRFAEEELDALCAAAGVSGETGRIAVAHTFDDQIETVVMRFAAGAGPGGLTGIPYARGRIVRPLLDARRTDVVAYLRHLGQAWREDATNADTSRMRARVRADAVPLLEDLNPGFAGSLARTLAVLRDEDEMLDAQARSLVSGLATTVPGEVRFDLAGLRVLARPMLRRALRVGLIAAFPEASRIEFEHVEAMADGLAAGPFARDLPDGLRAFTEYATLVISRTPDEAAQSAPSLLEVPGTVDLGEAGRVTAAWCEPVVRDDRMVAIIDADRLRGALIVDSVRPGDVIRPLGMKGTRKLQDVLTDAKVPRRSRARVPVVRDGETVVWVAGVRMSDDYAIQPGTVRAVEIAWSGPQTREG